MTPHLWTDPVGLPVGVSKTVGGLIEEISMKTSWLEPKDHLSVKGAG